MNDGCVRICALLGSLMAVASAPGATIDQMYVENGLNQDTYKPDPGAYYGLRFLGKAHHYVLDNGSSWNSGAGTYWPFQAYLASLEVVGNTIRYTLTFQPGDFVYRQTDYDAGQHSAQGELTALHPIVLVAQTGANTARSTGYVYLYSNEMTYYGEPRFNYYSASVGEWVPYDVTYTLYGGAVFNQQTFNTSFTYRMEGVVDFAAAIPEPGAWTLLSLGASVLVSRWRGRTR